MTQKGFQFVLVTTFIVAGVLLLTPGRINYGGTGSLDFVQYWTAHKVLQNSGNPYDPDKLFPIQQQLGLTAATPLMYWSPPFGIALLSPILSQPFPIAASIWLRCNILMHLFCCMASVALVTRLAGVPLGTEKKTTKAGAASTFFLAVIFPPFLAVAALGQSAMIPALGVTVLILALSNESSAQSGAFIGRVLGGAGLALTFLKPHLFFLLYWALFIRALYRRDLLIVLTAIVTTSILFAFSEFLYPRSTIYWLQSLGLTESGNVIPRSSYVTATPSSMVSVLISKDGLVPILPKILFPGVAVIATTVFAYRSRSQPLMSVVVLTLTAFSAAMAPYGWFFDQSVLITLGGFIVATAPRQFLGRMTIFSLWIACCLFGAYYSTYQLQFHHELWWFSFITLGWSVYVATRNVRSLPIQNVEGILSGGAK